MDVGAYERPPGSRRSAATVSGIPGEASGGRAQRLTPGDREPGLWVILHLAIALYGLCLFSVCVAMA